MRKTDDKKNRISSFFDYFRIGFNGLHELFLDYDRLKMISAINFFTKVKINDYVLITIFGQ